MFEAVSDSALFRVDVDGRVEDWATIRNHVRALLLELGAHSQLEAVAKARSLSLLY
jgi:hypothetical protein